MSGPGAATRSALLGQAMALAAFTVSWNLLEGAVAIAAAAVAESRALVGFGVDSFVESASAAVLIWRLRAERRAPERAERVERLAVRLIGATFLALAALVGVESIRALVAGDEPDTSTVGIALTVVSLVVMPVLARRKRMLGAQLGDRSVEADASQTQACVHLSAVVLGGLVLNAAFGWWWADPLAALGVVVFLVHEGRAALTAERVDDCC